MGEHARFSPSGSTRWINCPGSLLLEEYLKQKARELAAALGVEPDVDTPSSYAHEGSMCHLVAEKCLKQKLDADAYYGQTIQGVYMDEELILGIQVYLDEVRAQFAELKVEGARVEYRAEISDDCWGTADAVGWVKALILVNDLKMGKGVPVAAQGNTQLMIYAIGTILKLERELECPGRFQNCTGKIIQPRLDPPVRTAEWTREELVEFFTGTLKPAFTACLEENAPLIPGEKQCRWCFASGNCPGQEQQMLDLIAPFEATEEFPMLPVAEPDMSIVSDTRVNVLKKGLSDETIGNLMKQIPFVDAFINAVREEALRRAMRGQKIHGQKMVRGRISRVWGVEEKKVIGILQGHGINPFADPKLLTVAQAEKALMLHLKIKKAGLTELNLPVEVKEGKLTLADESSPKKEVHMTMEVKAATDQIVSEGIDDKTVQDVLLDAAETATGSQDAFVSGADALDDIIGMANAEDEKPPVIDPKKPLDGFATVKLYMPKASRKLPAIGSKRRMLIDYALNNKSATMKEAMTRLETNLGSLRKMLRFAHEIDGFGSREQKDGSLSIFEGDAGYKKTQHVLDATGKVIKQDYTPPTEGDAQDA